MPTPAKDIFPPLPEGFNMPFYYASLSVIWLYYEVDPAVVAPHLAKTGLEPALFDGKAVACFDFQRYTAHLSGVLSTVNEVELNVLAYPRACARQTPEMTLADFLGGGEQTKLIGAFRLHVAADNKVAVGAGQQLFAEPKFFTSFDYAVPDMNDPSRQVWDVTCNDPDDPKLAIFKLSADEAALKFTASAMSPIAQYSRDAKGRLLSCTWNLFGSFRSALLGKGKGPVVRFGKSPHAMRSDMQRLLQGARPAAVQIFDSAPVATQSRGFLVKGPRI